MLTWLKRVARTEVTVTLAALPGEPCRENGLVVWGNQLQVADRKAR